MTQTFKTNFELQEEVKNKVEELKRAKAEVKKLERKLLCSKASAKPADAAVPPGLQNLMAPMTPSFLNQGHHERYQNIQELERGSKRSKQHSVFWNKDNIIRSVRGGGAATKQAGVGSANIYGGGAASFLNPYARNESLGFKMPHAAEK